VFIFVVLLGFPVVLMMAWVLRVTSEGVKVETAPVGNKRFFGAAAVLAALAVAWFYLGQPAIRGAGGEVAARTIAVLPFVNMSGDAGNEYFSDGISEEILNVLARTPELQVAARMSSFALKGQNKEVPEIAQALQVFSSMEIPALLILLHAEDLVLDFIEGVADGDSGITYWGLLLPAVDPVRCAPRFVAAARTIRLKDPHAARVCGAAD